MEPYFDETAQAIAKRQYLLPGEEGILDLFRRVAREVARPEGEKAPFFEERFFELMATKRFSPGGRILAGAGTAHGNLLNCFVQGATENPPHTLAGIHEVARKLALVTKVGGGNGVNLDPYGPARRIQLPTMGFAYIRGDHPDAEDFVRGLMRPPLGGEKVPVHFRHFRRAVYGGVSPELLALARDHGVEVVESPPQGTILVPDDLGGIVDAGFKALELALKGEVPRLDLSLLRPEGAPIKGSGGTSSGPVSFLFELYENLLRLARLGGEEAGPVAILRYAYAPVLRVVRQGGVRRGAGMATLSVEHPDVLDFLTAKDLDRERAEGDISTFNISLLIPHRFMELLDRNGTLPIGARPVPGKYERVEMGRPYDGTLPDLPEGQIPVYTDGVPARWLFREIAKHAWATGEPGLIFIDRVNEASALYGLGPEYVIKCTNPCGEEPLLVGEACDLGALNLAAYVREGGFDWEAFRQDIHLAVRFLDNVLDVTRFALPDNERQVKRLRRLGLGVMGLADMLIRLGLPYDSEEARGFVERVMDVLREEATRASEELAKARGPFPLYEEHRAFFEGKGIPPRRNVALLTVAPTGTTSMIMGVSSGIEPVFAPFIWRRIGNEYRAIVHPLFQELLEAYPPHPAYAKDGRWDLEKVVEKVQENGGSLQGLDFIPEPIRRVFRTAHDISPLDHVRMQGAIQRAFDRGAYVGNSLSKTINLPHGAKVEDVEAAYYEAYRTGCKGITVYRDGSREGQVLNVKKDAPRAVDERAEGTASATLLPPLDRPGRLRGFTDMVKLHTAEGLKRSFLITVNLLLDRPIEVILTSGKAGDEANADSEALGRVVSIALQHGVPPEALIRTLRGINGGLYGSYLGRLVASKADLIAIALESALKEGEEAKGIGLPQDALLLSGGQEMPTPGETCPSCGGRTLVREEGCLSCKACGWSKCG